MNPPGAHARGGYDAHPVTTQEHAMLHIECQIEQRTAHRRIAGYRTSRQPHLPAAMAYARYVWQGITQAGRPATMAVTMRDDAGRIVHTWHWRKV